MNPRRSPVAFHLPPHGVYVWETQHDFGFQMDVEAHSFAEFFYVLDGSGVFVIDGTRYGCGSGDVIIVPSGTSHAIEDRQTPLTLYGIGVSADLLAHDPDALKQTRSGVVAGSRALSGRVRAGIRRMLYEQTDSRPGSRALIVGLTLQLVATLARAPATANNPPPEHPGADHRHAVERFLTELTHRFYEPVRIDRVADELGMSRRSFTRLFREVAHCSYAEFVERIRIEYACRLLSQTPRAIAPVAFECGYEDLSSFYRAFKRQVGQPPGHWREAAIATSAV